MNQHLQLYGDVNSSCTWQIDPRGTFSQSAFCNPFYVNVQRYAKVEDVV